MSAVVPDYESCGLIPLIEIIEYPSTTDAFTMEQTYVRPFTLFQYFVLHVHYAAKMLVNVHYLVRK